MNYMMLKSLFFLLSFLSVIQNIFALSLAEQLKHSGYVEIDDSPYYKTVTYDALYAYFDELVAFLQENPRWAQRLYCAKERFIRSADRQYYATEFFGFYDESELKGRYQISFYYSVHFHQFVYARYPDLKALPEIAQFFEACFEIQKPYGDLFNRVAVELGLATLFSSSYGQQPPILFKVVKYCDSYTPSRPHYDGTAFSLFLNSTDNESLLLSPYKQSFTIDDFFSPVRVLKEYSVVLIVGTLLQEYGIQPTPHIVIASDKPRYSTIAFALRPHFTSRNSALPVLPNFKT